MKKFTFAFRFNARGHKKGDVFFTLTTDDTRLVRKLSEDIPECVVFSS